jgi:molybdenum cofactor cytidylyltransferase
MQGILLAAGCGSRFDARGARDKLLVPLADGQPVLVHAARAMVAALPGTLAVVRPGQAARERVLHAAGCQVLVSPAAEAGMGAALADAVRARADAGPWVVSLGDMPCIPAALVAAVAAAIEGPQDIAAAFHQGRRGHPVAFGCGWGAELMALTGDQGARTLLARAKLRPVDWPEADILRDVDRPEDLAALLNPRCA